MDDKELQVVFHTVKGSAATIGLDIISNVAKEIEFSFKSSETKKIEGKAGEEAEAIEKGELKKDCPKCKKGELVLRSSIYGKFFGCSKYPKCKFIEKVEKEEKEEKEQPKEE